jgi:hypothetical protein
MSLVGYGVRQDGLPVLTASKIYNSMVLPRALYGAELWTTLTDSNMLQMERFHRLAAKTIQRFPRRTSTVAALGMLGWLPIEGLIDQKKLLFWGRLCRQDPDSLPSKVLKQRLFQYYYDATDRHIGFVSKTVQLMTKYGLGYILDKYLESGVWPSKLSWKRLVEQAVRAWHTTSSLALIESSRTLSLFGESHESAEPHIIWYIARATPQARRSLYSLARLCTLRGLAGQCTLCGTDTVDQVEHFLVTCPTRTAVRQLFWKTVVAELTETSVTHLRSLSARELVTVSLGKVPDGDFDQYDYSNFVVLTARSWSYVVLHMNYGY